MELNSLIFPAPSSSYGLKDLKELIWIPRSFNNEEHKLITKNFKQVTVKALILEENEAKALSTNREIKITKKFDNIKVQASIYKKDFISEDEVSEEKILNGPMTVVKDFDNCTVKASIDIEHKKENSQKSKNQSQSKEVSEKIPCHWVKYKGSKNLLLYFHGNAEDIGISTEFVEMLSKNLKINCLGVEYPGYGIYQGKPSSEQIIIDSEIVFDYLTLRLGVKAKNIIIFGRSIGSGPAAHLAAQRRVGGLVLMSAYTSIKDVAKNIAGSLAQYLVADRFRNIDKMRKIGCSVCFLHGKKDKLIAYKHSQELMDEFEKHQKGKDFISFHHFGENMTHNDFHFVHDLINPLKDFFKKTKIELKSNGNDENELENLPEEVFYAPKKMINKKSTPFNFYI